MNHQLKGKDEQLKALTKDLQIVKEWQKKAQIAKEIAKCIRVEL